MKFLKKNKKVILSIFFIAIVLFIYWDRKSHVFQEAIPEFQASLQSFTSISIDVSANPSIERIKKLSSDKMKKAVYTGCESAFIKNFKFRNVDVLPYDEKDTFSRKPLNINLSFSFGEVDESYIPRRSDIGSLVLVYSIERTEMGERVAGNLRSQREGRGLGANSYLHDKNPIQDFSKKIHRIKTYMGQQSVFSSEAIGVDDDEQLFLTEVSHRAKGVCKKLAKKMEPYTSEAEEAEARLLRKMESK